jgi:hypothetical protein
MELNEQEQKALYKLLGGMNYYEKMAILCKETTSDAEAETILDKINHITAKLCRVLEGK